MKETIFSVFTACVFKYIFLRSTKTIDRIGFIAWWKLAAKQLNDWETDNINLPNAKNTGLTISK